MEQWEINFWNNVDKNTGTGCWNWKRRVDRWGYGKVNIRNKTRGAHRVSWEIFNGDIPHGILVCHRCDNPACVNPARLFLGDQKDNMTDASKKGRIKLNKFNFNGTRGAPKLTSSDVIEIRNSYRDGENTSSLSKRFDVAIRHVRYIVNRETWKGVP